MIPEVPEIVREECDSPWTVDGATGDKTVHRVTESVVVGGIKYERTAQSCGTPFGTLYNHFTNHDADPGVLCGACFGRTFTLVYGGYSISAKCAYCGREDVVYDG